MQAFLVATGIVALAEIGDKTQLLSLLLATRFKRPWPIIAGILIATLLNHALAGALGVWLTQLLEPDLLRWLLGFSFIAMAAWMLVPDKLDDEESPSLQGYGVFVTTLLLFFLAEIGDKTQVATIALAAQYHDLLWVVVGTTLGMMLANVPVVLFGEAIAKRLSIRQVHRITAASFMMLGIVALFP